MVPGRFVTLSFLVTVITIGKRLIFDKSVTKRPGNRLVQKKSLTPRICINNLEKKKKLMFFLSFQIINASNVYILLFGCYMKSIAYSSQKEVLLCYMGYYF